MSLLHTLIDEAKALLGQLFEHVDPAVTSIASQAVSKLEAAKDAAVADAEALGREAAADAGQVVRTAESEGLGAAATQAVGDAESLAGEAGHDAAAVVEQATGGAPEAAPAGPTS